jgi:hypothetical protein
LDRFVCIHGHFYQPPRENPWLEAIEVQDSAAPYHDWNERVTAECYEPNARARILNDAGAIERIVNNYSRISFNFGPTLLSWLEERASRVYAAVLEADRESQARFTGHGSAIAQVYNHVIMPLASGRDKETQVAWGIADFEHRFGRAPEGMWLPETAVDTESLEVVAAHGISFVILAPHQARRVRKLAGGAWTETKDGSADTGMAYLVRLPSGRTLAAFFFEGTLAHGVAFERALEDGLDFGRKLLEGATAGEGPRLSHIATDGETFGHHHRFGDMALAAALELIEAGDVARLTNYGEFLERFPPAWEVEIAEATSWSCSHGLERWRSGCNCSTGVHPDWSQAWREPLRLSLDWLRERITPLYAGAASALLTDPWKARDAYVGVILDRRSPTIERFFAEQSAAKLGVEEKEKALKLLEMERNAMLMFTSCGWFFDDIAGVEAVQVLHYAARVIQLAEDLSGEEIESGFEEILAAAVSNRPESGTGLEVYRKQVKPSRVELDRVAAVFAITSLFEPHPEVTSIRCYELHREDLRLAEAGRTRVATGRVRVQSRITSEAATLCFATVDFGDQNVAGGVQEFVSIEEFERTRDEVEAAFSSADLTQVIRTIDTLFPGKWFSLASLFRDELRWILGLIAEPALEEAEAVYRSLYEEHIPLMRFLTSVGYPLPNRFAAAAEFALNLDLRRALADEEIDRGQVLSLVEEAGLTGIRLDLQGIAPVAQRASERLAARLAAEPGDAGTAGRLLKLLDLLKDAGIPVNLWATQNIFYDIVHGALSGHALPEAEPDWFDLYLDLGRALGVAVS